MKKLLAVSLGALVAAAAFAPAAQARHHRAPKAAVVVPGNPLIDPNGQFYATPVEAGGNATTLLLAPLAVPGAVVGGVTQPLLAPIAAPGELPGLDLLPR